MVHALVALIEVIPSVRERRRRVYRPLAVVMTVIFTMIEVIAMGRFPEAWSTWSPGGRVAALYLLGDYHHHFVTGKILRLKLSLEIRGGVTVKSSYKL